MSFIFSESWDFYSTTANTTDALQGYWDGGSMVVGSNCLLSTGRFTGSQALGTGATIVAYVFKNSGSNDAVHHVNVAFIHTVGLTSNILGMYIQLLDGSTGQCAIVFRSDGAIVLTSSTPGGSTLATYTGAFSSNVWTAFEFEVVINSSTGSFTVRKNGNTSADFTATGLNTRGGTSNNYASRLQLGLNSSTTPLNANNAQKFDDVLWRSDPTSLPWVGDVRAAQMMPATDSSVQFSKSTGSTLTTTPVASVTTLTGSATRTRYTAFTAVYDGTIGSIIVPLSAGYTGNMKCAIFASSGSAPTTVLGSATPISNPVTGNNTFSLSPAVSVTKSTGYYVGFAMDSASGTYTAGSINGNVGQFYDVAYSSFPIASPATSTGQTPAIFSYVTTLGSNATLVNESQEDGITSYVYDSTVGHADFYNISSIPTSSTITAVTTRGFMAKSDVGTRTAQVQLSSGGTTVQTTPLNISTSFQWVYRTDTVDPHTGSAWTATNLNSITIGPLVTS